MKRAKTLIVIMAIVMIATMLTGCLAVEMKVNNDGSCDVTYTIDISQLGGMMSKNDVEKAIKESVDDMNDRAGKKIAKLKSVKENKKEETITASISINDLNKMGDGSFFGTVKQYRKDNGIGLDNLVDKKGKSVGKKDVKDDLYVVYSPLTGSEDYGLVDVTLIVPGSIVYLTDGGEVEKNNQAQFSGEIPLVVFKKGGGGFPFWILLVAAAIIIIFLVIKKKPSATPVMSPPVTTNAPEATANAPADSFAGSVSTTPDVHNAPEE